MFTSGVLRARGPGDSGVLLRGASTQCPHGIFPFGASPACGVPRADSHALGEPVGGRTAVKPHG